MAASAQATASRNYRKRLKARGLQRFEVVGRATDKALLRALAAEIAHDSEQAKKLRRELAKAVNPANNSVLSVFDRPELRGLDLQIPPRGELSGEWVEF
jgi:Lon protease-like protein